MFDHSKNLFTICDNFFGVGGGGGGGAVIIDRVILDLHVLRLVILTLNFYAVLALLLTCSI